MKNGRDDHWEDPKITSISAARRKAEQARKGKASAKQTGARPSRGMGEWLLGALLVAMAIGLIVSVTRPLWQAAVAVGN